MNKKGNVSLCESALLEATVHHSYIVLSLLLPVLSLLIPVLNLLIPVLVMFCGFSLDLSMPTSESTCILLLSSSYYSVWDFNQEFLSSLWVIRCGGQIFQGNSQLLICQ